MKKPFVTSYLIFQQILMFIADYIDIFKNTKQLPAPINAFKLAVKDIDKITAMKKPNSIPVATKTKSQVKTEMIDGLVNTCQLALEWAKEAKNDQLIEDFSITKSSFRGGILNVINFAEYTFNVLVDNKTEILDKTDITETNYNKIEATIALLKQLQIAPKVARDKQKTINALYPAAFKKTNKVKETLENVIRGNYTTGPNANPKIILDLESALKYVEGVIHTRIQVLFVNAETGELIENAKIEIPALSRSALSTLSGIAFLVEFSGDTYKVIFSADKYITQSKIITIKTGDKLELTISLEPEKTV